VVSYPFVPLDEGAEISLGNVVVRVLHTPGHTPESMSLLITDRTRADEPWMVLTGDTLFVGDVGRPDFGGEDAGRQLYSSLQRLLALPDHVEVYPAHIAGSPCGRAMSAKPSSTIGFERRHNVALQHRTEETFVRALFAGLPPKPPWFAETVAANRRG
jgi:hydroxyacylglutathione hydrolase